MSRILRAPVFILGLVISFVPAIFIFATVTVGDWIERALRAAHVKPQRGWPFLVLGGFAYAGLGLVAPAFVGSVAFGLPGAIIATLLVLFLVARFGRW